MRLQYEHWSSEHTTRETTRQTCARRKTESDFEERWNNTIQICLHETFIFGPRQIGSCWNSETFGPENEREFDFVPLKCAARYLVWSPKQRWDFEDRNMLTTSQSSRTATLLATQFRRRARRDWWLRLVTTLWNLDRRFGAWQHWAFERRSFTQWWKKVKLDYPWDLYTRIWDCQWRLKYTVTVWRRIHWRIDWEQWSDRSTLTRGTFGYKNEPKTETSVSRRCQQQRTAQTLEGSQALLQYYNNIASLQDWFSADHGSHTPLQDEGWRCQWCIWGRSCRPDMNTENRYRQRPDLITWNRQKHRNNQLSTLIVNIETDVPAEWNQWMVDKFEHFSRWTDHDSSCKKQSKGKVQSNGKMQRENLWTGWLQSWR